MDGFAKNVTAAGIGVRRCINMAVFKRCDLARGLNEAIARSMQRVASVATWNTSPPFLQPLEWAKISLFYADSAFIKPLAPMIFMTRFFL